MNVLIIGSGAREHAIAWSVKKSKQVDNLFVMPGNAGTSSIAKNVAVDVSDHAAVVDFCEEKDVGFVIVGPEQPLVDGIVDDLQKAGISCFGPTERAAILEQSKKATKEICDKYNIPTARYGAFTDANEAKKYLKSVDLPIVIKADGLAAGKGVIIAREIEEAIAAIDTIMVDKKFGDAGNEVVIEEFLVGEEISFFALSDGDVAIEFGSAQDHKAVGEGDTGANTGGMGTYSPAPIMTQSMSDTIMRDIINPIVTGMKEKGSAFRGVIFAGLMVTGSGPKLLEINVRFGDPETQVLMARLQSDLLGLLQATNDSVAEQKVVMSDQAALCVVMAANGYPGSYKKGTLIKNLNEAGRLGDTVIFHAGTKISDAGEIVANGGRVLGVTALGSTVADAQSRAYNVVNAVDWEDGFYRRDIGYRAVEREKKSC